MGSNALIEPVTFNPRELNLNARAFAATIESDPIGCEGYNQLTLEFFMDYVAATDFFFYVSFWSTELQTWKRIQVGDLDPTTGVETFVDRQFYFATGAADLNKLVNIAINGEKLKIEGIDGASASTDTITMIARLGNT